MLSFRLLAIPLVMLALFGVADAAGSPDAAITAAAVAPYRDELLRDAPALCSDLAHPPTITPTASQGSSCEQAWLVSTQARLVAVGDCQLRPRGQCQAGVNDLVFVLGVPLGQIPQEALPIPTAVQRASSRERGEFAAGRTVFAQSGCLACHKVGDEGNRRPGQNLTHIGAQLSSAQIEHALLSPRQPMPSFKHLPAKKLHDLMRFMSLMP